MPHTYNPTTARTTEAQTTTQTQQPLSETPLQKDIERTLQRNPDVKSLLESDPETGLTRLTFELKNEFGWEVTKNRVETILETRSMEVEIE